VRELDRLALFFSTLSGSEYGEFSLFYLASGVEPVLPLLED
jgi:hypothetical protein